MKRFALSLAVLSLFAGPAAAENYKIGSIEIDDPWLRATPRGADVAGAYMTLVNKGTDPDRLVGGSLTGASRFELHGMEMQGDVSKMRPVEGGIEIKPGESVTLTPSSLHIMLSGLKQSFQQGQHVKGSLTFQKAGKVDVDFTVKSIGASSSMPGMH